MGKGQFTIVSDLPRQGSNKIQTDQMSNAIDLVLQQFKIANGEALETRAHVGHRRADLRSKLGGELLGVHGSRSLGPIVARAHR